MPSRIAGHEVVYEDYIKRLLDLGLSVVALPLFGIICIIVAPAIYLDDPGPVFYNAPRLGKDHKVFKMYKFRSMKVDAPDLKMPDGSTYNAPDDPRVTRVGKILRDTSLDETPQILNVIKGDMSIVGPRPDLIEEGELYTGDDVRKLEVRPGITGYAAVYGRNAIPWKERLRLDVHYVKNVSFKLDAKIFFKSFAVVTRQEGVYVEPDGGAGIHERPSS
jgi:undecaprenyl phosphate N,N'-diacetylbacillosamine 1-phosphate transferase